MIPWVCMSTSITFMPLYCHYSFSSFHSESSQLFTCCGCTNICCLLFSCLFVYDISLVDSSQAFLWGSFFIIQWTVFQNFVIGVIIVIHFDIQPLLWHSHPLAWSVLYLLDFSVSCSRSLSLFTTIFSRWGDSYSYSHDIICPGHGATYVLRFAIKMDNVQTPWNREMINWCFSYAVVV